MEEEARAQDGCEQKCKAVAAKCLDDAYDSASCQIKYNRCRFTCGRV